MLSENLIITLTIIYHENPVSKNICKSEGNQDKSISILESWNIYI